MPSRRAILVSFDALNERRVLETLPAEAIPTFHRLFTAGACADYARTAFPSVTAPSHAALWTGAYGNVTGITNNSQPVLPRDEHTLLEDISGFAHDALRAEPIWITAAAAGVPVVGHHVTQAPDAPGYPPVEGVRAPAIAAARERAVAALQQPSAMILNGYNRTVAYDLAITDSTAPPRPARGWRNLDRLERNEWGPPPLEIAWRVGRDSVYGLLYGDSAYTHVLVARERDAGGGVTAAAAPATRQPLAHYRSPSTELARHFSPPLELPVDDGRAFLRIRVFELAPDGSRFLIFQPALNIVQGNRPDVAAAYDAAVDGWTGNGASYLLERGRFGPTIQEGGDGTAEDRWLETLEYVTRQFVRGAEWAWRERSPRLLLDYFPVGDQVDHDYYGYIDPSSPKHDPALAARIQEVRARGWALVDRRLAHLVQLVEEPGAALFVSGDHGMRARWRLFRPNVALMNVGLAAVDSAGRIDLTRTHAFSPNGYFVVVNSTRWKGGIVSPEREAAVLDAAERALRLARAPDGSAIVTRIWRAGTPEGDSLGLGGPAGGDLYYEVADGYRWTAETRGFVTDTTRLDGGHGYPSVAPDMYTVLCAIGRGFPAHRIGPARTIDAAPTVAEWLGFPAPPMAVGVSLLDRLTNR